MIHYDDLAGVVCKESDNQDPARPSRSRDGGRPSEFPAQLLLPRHHCQRGCQEEKSVFSFSSKGASEFASTWMMDPTMIFATRGSPRSQK